MQVSDELLRAFKEASESMDGLPWYCISYGEKCYAYAVVEACPWDEDEDQPPAGQWLKPHEDGDHNRWVAEDGTVMMTMGTVLNVDEQHGAVICDFVAKAYAAFAALAAQGGA